MKEVGDYAVTVFIDTNVILEGKGLKDLPWKEIHPSGPILVLLLPTLLQEVDSKKRDGRLGVRARDFNRLISPLAAGSEKITVCEANPRVDVALAVCARIKWDLYDELDPNEGDSRLVAEALHVKNPPKGPLILLSQDINPLILSRRHGLATHHLSELWLMQMEQSPHEKELAKLRRQIADYEKTEPVFEVKAVAPNEPVSIYSVECLNASEADALKDKILQDNPRPIQERSLHHHIGLTGGHDYSLDKRYDEYKDETVPAFIDQLHEKLELRHDQIPFRFSLSNLGKVRAENMHVEVRVAHGWLNRQVIMSAIVPSAPKAKSQIPVHNFTNFHRPSPPAGRHEVEVDEISKSKLFAAQCQDFRQGQTWEFDGVLWLDPNAEQAATVIISVTAANFHGSFQHVVKVPKAVQKAKVFDLIDYEGKSKVEPHVYSMFDDAIGKERYDLIEWDRIE